MKLNIIEPNYFKDFHCIGGECRNNCCHDWGIYLTKKEYINTKNAKKSKELQEICDHAFHRLKKSENPNIYAEMRLKEDGNCQFLDKDGLCMLQKECGYNILSNTCKQFPRIHFQYMATAEQYLSTGCEEVVRLLMNMPDGIELTSGGEIDHNKFNNPTLSVIDPEKVSEAPFKFYWDVKTLVISIMKNRNYSVEDRLILLGIAFKHIDELINANEGDKIPPYVDGLIAACTDDKSMLDGLNDIEPKTELNALNFANIFARVTQSRSIPEEFAEKIKAAYGIVYDLSEDEEELHFNLDREKVEKQLGYLFNMLSGREYILENFMLNSILFLNLPFTNTSLSFWDSYIFICMVYSVMMFMIAGNLTEKSYNSDIIEAVVLFSRCLFHNPNLPGVIIETIKKNDFSNLGSMVSLIKF